MRIEERKRISIKPQMNAFICGSIYFLGSEVFE